MFEFCIRKLDGVYLMKTNASEGEDTTTLAESPMESFRNATNNRRKGR